jgi:hypothetical protein
MHGRRKAFPAFSAARPVASSRLPEDLRHCADRSRVFYTWAAGSPTLFPPPVLRQPRSVQKVWAILPTGVRVYVRTADTGHHPPSVLGHPPGSGSGFRS